HNGEEFHRIGKPKCNRCDGTPASQERGRRHHQQQRTDDIDMTAARYFRRQQWMPGISQNPVLTLTRSTQNIEQHKYNGKIANYKAYFKRESRLVNRRYSAKQQLRSRWIRARHLRIIQHARLRCVQAGKGRFVWYEDIRVIAEPLHATIPNIPVNVVIY